VNKHQTIGLIGSGLLIVGAFLPVVSVPILGAQTLFQNGEGDGSVILVLAVVSVVLVILERMRGLFITGGLSLLLLVVSFFTLRSRISDIKNQLSIELEDNPFKELAQTGVDLVQAQYGWGVLLMGTILLIVAAYLGVGGYISMARPQDDPRCDHSGQTGKHCTECGTSLDTQCEHVDQSGQFCTICGVRLDKSK